VSFSFKSNWNRLDSKSLYAQQNRRCQKDGFQIATEEGDAPNGNQDNAAISTQESG
jgi:hypothetical protein